MSKTPTASLDPSVPAPSDGPGRPQGTAAPGAAVGLKSGTRLGKYEVVGRLGVGGMAVVYKGYDPLLDRFVAIKQISSHLAADPKFLERFRKEAQILAKLGADQSAVVQIYELIEDRRGLFIVTEFVDGQTLDLLIERQKGPMPEKLALEILWHVAVGLRAVHEKGIIHRDIKPGNIMVGVNRRCKITDFGVAARSGGKTSMTLGTTKYMAPELFGGGEVDGRSDIYSLGFIVYEMLAGPDKFKQVFADVVRDDRAESLRWMKWHTNMDMMAPMLNQVNPAVPEILAKIVAKMMAKKAEHRFQSAEHLLEILKRHFTQAGQVQKAAATAARQKVRAAKAAPPERKPEPIPDRAAAAAAVAAAGPKTTFLPKRKMTRRQRIIAAAALLALTCTVAFLWMGRDWTRRESYERAASAEYERAADEWRRGNWTKARDMLRDTQRRYPQSEAVTTLIPDRITLLDGYIAMSQHNWTRCSEVEQTLEDRARRGRIGVTVRETQEFWKLWRMERSFVGKLDEATKLIEQGLEQMDPRKFDDAKTILDEAQQLKKTANLSAWYIKREEALADYQYRDLLARADRAAKAQRSEEAKQLLFKAAAIRNTPEVAQRLAAIDRLKEYAALIAASDAFLKAGDADGAARKLTEAHRLVQQMSPAEKVEADKTRPTDKLADHITQLQSISLTAQAQQAIAGNQLETARLLLNKALSVNPNNALAKRLLEQLDANKSIMELWAAGQAAMDKGEYLAAVKMLAQVRGQIPKDEDRRKIGEQIRLCYFRVYDDEAATRFKEDRLDEAEAKWTEALKFTTDPAVTQRINGQLATIGTTREYRRLRDLGDKLFAGGQLDTSYERYKDARTVAKNGGLAASVLAEIDGRIKENRYTNCMQNARSYVAQKMWPEAMGWLNMAAGHKVTRELEELRAEVRANVPVAEGGTQGATPPPGP